MSTDRTRPGDVSNKATQTEHVAEEDQEPFYVSARVERALSEAARTGRDINIGGALYRKVNHGERAGDRVVGGWTEVMWGALDYDGSMDWEPERADAEKTAEQYDLPLYRVSIVHEQVIRPEEGRSVDGDPA